LVGGEILENLLRQNHISICPSVRRAGDLETAKLTLMEETAKLKAAHGRLAEIAEATEELTGAADEAITYRLGQAALAFDRATRAQQEDTTEYEKADNGMRVDRKEREALHGLLANLGKTPKH
jgi:DNA primase